MKNKLFMIITAILILGCCIGICYYVEDYHKVYYTKIDNTKIKKLSTNDSMKYEYSLESYNEKGRKKDNYNDNHYRNYNDRRNFIIKKF